MSSLNLLAANVRKIGIEMVRYLPNTLSLVVTFYAIFLAMFLGVKAVGDPNQVDASVQYIIVSNAFWFLAIMAMQEIGWQITNEATRGTLEQLYMSPMDVWRILLARMIGTVIFNLVIIVLMLILVMATARQWLHFDLSILPILAFTLASMIGVGFVMAGLAIIFKQIQALLQIVQFVFFALVFVPLSAAPWLEFAPFVKGVDLVRQVMTGGLSLGQIPLLDWVSLTLNAVVYFALGVLIFKRCEHIAMQRGLLGQY